MYERKEKRSMWVWILLWSKTTELKSIVDIKPITNTIIVINCDSNRWHDWWNIAPINGLHELLKHSIEMRITEEAWSLWSDHKQCANVQWDNLLFFPHCILFLSDSLLFYYFVRVLFGVWNEFIELPVVHIFTSKCF